MYYDHINLEKSATQSSSKGQGIQVPLLLIELLANLSAWMYSDDTFMYNFTLSAYIILFWGCVELKLTDV